jgi:hypothetical protein
MQRIQVHIVESASVAALITDVNDWLDNNIYGTDRVFKDIIYSETGPSAMIVFVEEATLEAPQP